MESPSWQMTGFMNWSRLLQFGSSTEHCIHKITFETLYSAPSITFQEGCFQDGKHLCLSSVFISSPLWNCTSPSPIMWLLYDLLCLLMPSKLEGQPEYFYVKCECVCVCVCVIRAFSLHQEVTQLQTAGSQSFLPHGEQLVVTDFNCSKEGQAEM